jgi:hypothetical protein
MVLWSALCLKCLIIQECPLRICKECQEFLQRLFGFFGPRYILDRTWFILSPSAKKKLTSIRPRVELACNPLNRELFKKKHGRAEETTEKDFGDYIDCLDAF